MKTALIYGLIMLWIASLPVVVLGIGFSGGEILNPLKIVSDLARGDVYSLNRLWACAVVVAPVIGLAFLVRQLRRKRHI